MSSRLTLALVALFVFALSCPGSVQQEKKPQTVTFGTIAPAKDLRFRTSKKTVTKMQMIQAGKLQTQDLTAEQVYETKALRVVDGKITAARFTFEKASDINTLVFDGKEATRKTPDIRVGKSYDVALDDGVLLINYPPGAKPSDEDSAQLYANFEKDLKRQIPMGVVFDPAKERGGTLRGKTFEVGKTYENLFRDAPEMKETLKRFKAMNAKPEITSTTIIVSLTTIEGKRCAVVKNTIKMKTKQKRKGLTLEMSLELNETATYSVDQAWHVNSNSTTKLTMLGLDKKDKTILKLSSSSTIAESTTQNVALPSK